ncbi:serine hydrolase domain-containing protein [Streptomyces olindensis]|uniref:serine hydrolase domain-containing protein n=1 Tax=Streptomyces olindensis TaxID=358823 RepID=UPI003F4D41FE
MRDQGAADPGEQVPESRRVPETPEWSCLAARAQSLIDSGLAQGIYPGAVWMAGDADGPQAGGAVGVLDPLEDPTPMTSDTVFDIASLTKVTTLWPLIGLLWEEGRCELDSHVDELLPETKGRPLAQVTVRHLLTHTAGLPKRANLRALYGADPTAIWRGILNEPLHDVPGRRVAYCDRAALVLGLIAQRLLGDQLADAARKLVWAPLGMDDTRYGPLPSESRKRCAPTEYDETARQRVRGTVHDYSARLLGETAGNSGVFSTAADLARFLHHLLVAGRGAHSVVPPTWISLSLQVHTRDLEPAWGLVWMLDRRPDPAAQAFVHYGFTGTGIWVSRKRSRWAVLLTNKIYYSRSFAPLDEIRSVFSTFVFP